MRKRILLFVLCISVLVMVSGCDKDQALDHYKKAIENAGDINLTKDKDLHGQREFGTDKYVGNYEGTYQNFSGEEILFGGTTVEREAGNTIHVKCDVDIREGSADIILQSGNEVPEILIQDTGQYEKEMELPDASNYISVKGNGFSGSVKIEIQ